MGLILLSFYSTHAIMGWNDNVGVILDSTSTFLSLMVQDKCDLNQIVNIFFSVLPLLEIQSCICKCKIGCGAVWERKRENK